MRWCCGDLRQRCNQYIGTAAQLRCGVWTDLKAHEALLNFNWCHKEVNRSINLCILLFYLHSKTPFPSSHLAGDYPVTGQWECSHHWQLPATQWLHSWSTGWSLCYQQLTTVTTLHCHYPVTLWTLCLEGDWWNKAFCCVYVCELINISIVLPAFIQVHTYIAATKKGNEVWVFGIWVWKPHTPGRESAYENSS